MLVGNAARPFGFPNPLFTYSITGPDPGRHAAPALPARLDPATASSLPGSYPINGSFSSAEGYAVNVVPGTLLIIGALDLPKPDVLRDKPTT